MKKFIIALLAAVLPALALSAQSYSVNGNTVRIYSPEVSDTVRMVVTADTHLSISDSREEPYREYSKRMAGAYLKTRHFITGKKTNPRGGP